MEGSRWHQLVREEFSLHSGGIRGESTGEEVVVQCVYGQVLGEKMREGYRGCSRATKRRDRKVCVCGGGVEYYSPPNKNEKSRHVTNSMKERKIEDWAGNLVFGRTARRHIDLEDCSRHHIPSCA